MIIDFHTHIWTKKMVSPGYKEYLSNFTEIAQSNINVYEADPNKLIENMEFKGSSFNGFYVNNRYRYGNNYQIKFQEEQDV